METKHLYRIFTGPSFAVWADFAKISEDSFFKGTWQRGRFSGVFAEIGLA
jgi:hypothetical protein